MNRRGFLGALVAAALAPLAKWLPEPTRWGTRDLGPAPTCTVTTSSEALRIVYRQEPKPGWYKIPEDYGSLAVAEDDLPAVLDGPYTFEITPNDDDPYNFRA